MTGTARARAKAFAAAAGVLGVVLLFLGGSGPAEGSQPDLNRVRQATAAFHTLHHAEHAGYSRFLDCMDDGHGKGMGQHYVNSALLLDGGALDATTPEALVYDESSGKARLVAVEYVVPGVPTDPAPHLLGQPFTYNTALGVWKLHYWVWRANPDGVFADYSPAVPACAGGGMAMQH